MSRRWWLVLALIAVLSPAMAWAAGKVAGRIDRLTFFSRGGPVIAPTAYTVSDGATFIGRVSEFETLAPVEDPIVFLGDSITDQARWAEYFPGLPIRNHGILGDRVVGVSARLNQVIALEPVRIFLLIGTNDISKGQSVEKTAAQIERVLDRLAAELPDAQVFVTSLTPREAGYKDTIEAHNARIEAAAAARGYAFVDLYSELLGTDGGIARRYTYDNLHLTGEAYTLWRERIGPCVRGEPACPYTPGAN